MPELNSPSSDSQVNKVIKAVTNHMRDHQLRVGDSMPSEASFAQRLGVSKTVMREAFAALSAMKVLDVGNGRRAKVGALNGTVFSTSLAHGIGTAQISIANVWEVRQTIERKTAMLAAEHRTAAEAAEIVRLAEMLALERDDLNQITRDDIAFHIAIAAASHNNLFVQIVASFAPLMESAIPAAWQTRRTEEERMIIVEHHRVLAAAIAARDVEGAGLAMLRHFDASIGAVLTSMTSLV